MTDLRKLGDELRSELGEPPAGWTDQQRLKLRGVELEPAPKTQPRFLLAALAAGTLLASVYFWPSTKTSGTAGKDKGALGGPTTRSGDKSGEEIWVEAGSKSTTHHLDDGSEIALDPGARGRLDQREDLGIRFDLHEGTATFDVKKQQENSFSVVAGKYRVVVVGTRFMTAYVPPNELKVAVEEGAVQVHLPGRAAPISVGAGESLEIEGREF